MNASLGFSGFLRCVCVHMFSISFLYIIDLCRYLSTSVILAICDSCDIRVVGMVCQALFSMR